MTKRHFKALAEAIQTISDETVRKQAAEAIAVACQLFNDNFDEKRFLKCCKVVV